MQLWVHHTHLALDPDSSRHQEREILNLKVAGGQGNLGWEVRGINTLQAEISLAAIYLIILCVVLWLFCSFCYCCHCFFGFF